MGVQRQMMSELTELANELEQDADEYGRIADSDRVHIRVEYETDAGNTLSRSGDVWAVDEGSRSGVKIRFSENAGESDEDPYFVNMNRSDPVVVSVSDRGNETELGPVTGLDVDREDTDDASEDPEPTTDGGREVRADGGQDTESEVPPEQASEGDTISVVYDSPRSDEDLTREGEILEIELWETDGRVDTIRFITPSDECRIRFAPDGSHILEQKSSRWTKLGRTTSVTITTDTATDGGEWDPEPAALRDGETEDRSSHSASLNETSWDVARREGTIPSDFPDDEDANPGDDAGDTARTDGGVVEATDREVREAVEREGQRVMTDGGEDMDACHPALYVVHRSRTSPEDVPPAGDVADAITEGLEAAGWSSPSDILIDVREGTLMIQDEVPPADPVEWYGVAAVFGQTPATFTHGFPGPFRLAMDAIHDAFPDMEIHVDAVPGSRGGPNV